MNTVEELLTLHEGRKDKLYVDTKGKMTIGVGRNLTDRGLSDSEIDLLLANDISQAREDCLVLFGDAFSGANDARQAALIDMAFMGRPRLSTFFNLIEAVRGGDWEKAAAEAVKSKWAQQTGNRANDVAFLLRSGDWTVLGGGS